MAAYPRFPRVVDDVNVRLIAAVVLVLAVTALALNQWWIYAGPPKRFAAAIGAALTTSAAVLWVLGVAAPVVVTIGAIMVVFPALESILGLCVGCKVFAVLMRLGLVPAEICLECADISLRQRSLPSTG